MLKNTFGVRRSRARRLVRLLLPAAVAASLLVGGYVGYVAIRHSRHVTLPVPDGVFSVGRVMADWTDVTRTDPLAPRPGSARKLAVWLWYPATTEARAEPSPYLPGRWAGLHLGGVAGIGQTRPDAVRDHAVAGAPVAAGRFPVVVFEPGLGFAAPQYAALAEDVASHGYLVIGVTPTYSANLTVVNDEVIGTSAAGSPAAFDGDDLHSPAAQRAGDRLVAVWAADARFVAAQAAVLDRFGPLAGHVDAGRVAYAGHSFGGAAALQACHDDPHCAAAANLDGTQYGTVVHTGLTPPMLTLGTGTACLTGTCRPASTSDRSDLATAHALLAASRGPTWTVRVADMRHFDVSDYDAYYLAAPLRRLLPLGSLPGGRGIVITNAYLTAFLDRAVHGTDQPLLDADSASFPEVQVTGRG